MRTIVLLASLAFAAADTTDTLAAMTKDVQAIVAARAATYNCTHREERARDREHREGGSRDDVPWWANEMRTGHPLPSCVAVWRCCVALLCAVSLCCCVLLLLASTTKSNPGEI